ncbi:DUF4878 domain-containing protein [bacterium]|nr:DUF4878 domain-containing protein [bacterium]
MLRTVAFLCFLLAAVSVFGGTAKGNFVLDGKTYAINSVQARTDENPFEKSKKDILVLLTDQPVAESDFDLYNLDTLAESGKLHGILVRLDDEKQATGLIVLGTVQRSGNSVCNFEPTKFDLSRVAGKVYLAEPDESFGRKYTFDVEFDTDVKDKIAPALDETSGTPLPPDGGEPGKAFREYEKAIQSGNPQELKKYIVPEQAKKLDDPQAANMLGLMKMMRATEVKIVKGLLQGDRAILTVEGKDPVSNNKTSGSVRMVKLDGKWILEKESWTSSN